MVVVPVQERGEAGVAADLKMACEVHPPMWCQWSPWDLWPRVVVLEMAGEVHPPGWWSNQNIWWRSWPRVVKLAEEYDSWQPEAVV